MKKQYTQPNLWQRLKKFIRRLIFQKCFKPFYRPLFKMAISDRQLLERLRYELEFMELERQLFSDAPRHRARWHLNQAVIRHCIDKSLNGQILEFGVWKGSSINRIAKMMPDKMIYGFDSFEGLPEDWVRGKYISLKPEKFNLQGQLPKVESNVTLIKGWFNETLPSFLKEHPEPVALVHIDSDIYSSAKYILETIPLQDGTIVIFDEFFGYPEWRNGEYKAWNEFLDKHPHIQARCLGFVHPSGQVAFELSMASGASSKSEGTSKDVVSQC